MKQGIYHYSPILNFQLGNCGTLFLNMAEMANTNTTFHLDKKLYSSTGQNGLSMNLYMFDDNETMKLNFSYDVKLEISDESITVKHPNGCEENYIYKEKLNAYQLATGYNLIRKQDEEYILTDSSGVKYTFRSLNNNYYLHFYR